MTYDVFVEISDDLGPELRDRLLSLAYRTSRARRVALVLRGVSPETVDRRLDPVVESEGTQVGGVRYLEVDEAKQLLDESGADRPLVLTPDPAWLPDGDACSVRLRSPEVALALREEDTRSAGTAR